MSKNNNNSNGAADEAEERDAANARTSNNTDNINNTSNPSDGVAGPAGERNAGIVSGNTTHEHQASQSTSARATARNANNPRDGADVASGEQNATAGSSEITHPQRAKAKDPFLFYSNRENLDRARNFEEVDYSNEDSLRGTTDRKKAISFEKDHASLMMDMLHFGDEGN